MSFPISGVAPPVPATGAVASSPLALPANTTLPSSKVEAQDFASMMKGLGGDPAIRPGAKANAKTDKPSFIESFAAVQNANFQQLIQTSRDLVRSAPSMKYDELSLASMEFKLNVAVTSTQFQVATSVGKNAGKGVDTLMRNQ